MEGACRDSRVPAQSGVRYLSVDEVIREEVIQLFIRCHYDIPTLLTNVTRSLQHIGRHDLSLHRNEEGTAFTMTQSIAYASSRRGYEKENAPHMSTVEYRRREVAESIARINQVQMGGMNAFQAATAAAVGVKPRSPQVPFSGVIASPATPYVHGRHKENEKENAMERSTYELARGHITTFHEAARQLQNASGVQGQARSRDPMRSTARESGALLHRRVPPSHFNRQKSSRVPLGGREGGNSQERQHFSPSYNGNYILQRYGTH